MSVPSPCVDVCKVAGDLCLGCGRTLAEIAAWPTASDDTRRGIVEAAAARRLPIPR